MQFNWTTVSNASGYTLYWCQRTLDYSPTGEKCTNASAVRRRFYITCFYSFDSFRVQLPHRII